MRSPATVGPTAQSWADSRRRSTSINRTSATDLTRIGADLAGTFVEPRAIALVAEFRIISLRC